MNDRDALIRGKLLDRLTAVGVDARNLAVEVAAGTVTVRGTVPTDEARDRAMEALIGAHALEISVRSVAPVDSTRPIPPEEFSDRSAVRP